MCRYHFDAKCDTYVKLYIVDAKYYNKNGKKVCHIHQLHCLAACLLLLLLRPLRAGCSVDSARLAILQLHMSCYMYSLVSPRNHSGRTCW